MENFFRFFPLWKRGMKGDLTAFQKAKRLQNFKRKSFPDLNPGESTPPGWAPDSLP
jgi:hypothetical protein